MASFNSPPPLSFTASRLDGRVVLVTGASSGIGRAAVKRFAAEGAIVIAAARRLDRLNQVVDEVRAAGGEAVGVACDVTDEDSVPTRSEAFDAMVPDDVARARMADHYPMNDIADPDDMARAAALRRVTLDHWSGAACDGGFSVQ